MAKFTNEFKTDEWEVETPTGYQSFSGIGETVPYKVWILKTLNLTLRCADKHIVYRIDPHTNTTEETFVDELKTGDVIQSKEGCEVVTSVEETDEVAPMYDLTDVEGGNVYYTNDILSHNSTTVIAYLLHMVLFNPNQNVAILANKLATARELLHRLKLAYEHLPKWIQQGVITWNKGSIELENGSKILASATSSSAVRGASFNCILLDEFAYVPFNIADEFFSSVYPTISSGKTTKVIIVSTPKGMNMYYKLWTDSVNGRNEYVPVEVFWDEVPGRDEAWKEQTIKNTSEEQFRTEFESFSTETEVFVSLTGETDTNKGGKDMTIGELYEELKSKRKITKRTPNRS